MSEKTKVMAVTATMITDLVAYVRVPEEMTEDQLITWYRENGANGEFEENGNGGWEWQSAFDVTDANDITIHQGPTMEEVE